MGYNGVLLRMNSLKRNLIHNLVIMLHRVLSKYDLNWHSLYYERSSRCKYILHVH